MVALVRAGAELRTGDWQKETRRRTPRDQEPIHNCENVEGGDLRLV